MTHDLEAGPPPTGKATRPRRPTMIDVARHAGVSLKTVSRVVNREPRVNVSVVLGFPPEDFHVRLFQGYGVVSGVRGTTVLVSRVRPEDVRRIARYYWVRRITLQ